MHVCWWTLSFDKGYFGLFNFKSIEIDTVVNTCVWLVSNEYVADSLRCLAVCHMNVRCFQFPRCCIAHFSLSGCLME